MNGKETESDITSTHFRCENLAKYVSKEKQRKVGKVKFDYVGGWDKTNVFNFVGLQLVMLEVISIGQQNKQKFSRNYW